jgi:hypothetical protein
MCPNAAIGGVKSNSDAPRMRRFLTAKIRISAAANSAGPDAGTRQDCVEAIVAFERGLSLARSRRDRSRTLRRNARDSAEPIGDWFAPAPLVDTQLFTKDMEAPLSGFTLIRC